MDLVYSNVPVWSRLLSVKYASRRLRSFHGEDSNSGIGVLGPEHRLHA